jgi:hypothetical protein
MKYLKSFMDFLYDWAEIIHEHRKKYKITPLY